MKPITPQELAKDSIRFGDIVIYNGSLFWSESRPEENGRSVVLNDRFEECTPKTATVRSRVHEYGGGAFTIANDKVLYSNDGDLYHGEKQITNTSSKRFANLIFDGRFIYAVCEEKGKNSIVRISLLGEIETIHDTFDFYSSLALNNNKTKLAFICWNHPNMPWDDTKLFLLDLGLGSEKLIAEGASLFQPSFDDNDELYYVSDTNGFWNLYSENQGIILPMEAEFGEASWIFGLSRIAHTPFGFACIYTEKGIDSLGLITDSLEKIDLPFTAYRTLCASKSHLYFLAGSPTVPETLYSYDLEKKTLRAIRTSQQASSEQISLPEPVEFTSGNATAYGNYYPPIGSRQNAPLVVKVHGGPTTYAKQILDLRVQFYTSRGYGVLDVNYGGSTGYGKAYKDRLNGNWGLVDVDDCCNGARYLCDQGLADPKKLIIKGSSAGGYTVLAALAFKDVFSCGISYYGISDLCSLAKETHKFEAYYTDRLVAPYPEGEEIYKERSPLYHAEKINVPILFLQGEDDTVVPPSQATAMIEKVKTLTEYHLFPGEQHGFRAAKTIIKAAQAELQFLQKVLP